LFFIEIESLRKCNETEDIRKKIGCCAIEDLCVQSCDIGKVTLSCCTRTLFGERIIDLFGTSVVAVLHWGNEKCLKIKGAM
jgi:hypothetical protein